jgi:hypothetical protein
MCVGTKILVKQKGGGVMLPKHSPDEDAQKLVQNLELSPTEEISIKNDY